MMRSLVSLLGALAGSVLTGCSSLVSWTPPPQQQAHNQNAVPVVPERKVEANEYMVRQGDTVFSIAFRSSLDYRELAKWNRIGTDFLIRPGQVLKLYRPADQGQTIGDTITNAAPDLQLPDKSPRPLALPVQVPDVAVIPADPKAFKPTPPPPAASAPAKDPEPEPPTSQADNAYSWQWPTQGVVVRGYNPGAGAKGLDFSGKLGQTVMAAAPGKVVYSGSALKGYGELIIVKHDDLRLSAYGYNRKRLVKEGEMVRGGQAIAELGMGPENKPILHFEIRERGQPVNPASFLPAKTALK